MMIEGGIYGYAIPAGRTIAGFFLGVMLGILGGWMGVTFNAFVGYPWEQQVSLGIYSFNVHEFIYVVSIGLGAGLGAYTGWINLGLRRYVIVLLVLAVLVSGIIGSIIGNVYWEYITGSPTYLGARNTRLNITHFGAAFGAIATATAQGLYYHFRTRG